MRSALGVGLSETELGAVVPVATGPGAWSIAVVLAVSVSGAAIGAATATESEEPQQPRRARAPILALLALAVGAVLITLVSPMLVMSGDYAAVDAISNVSIVLGVLGLVGLGPWVTGGFASWLASRFAGGARTVPTLLAARRLSADPRPAARATMATSVAGLTLGVCGSLVADLTLNSDLYGGEHLPPTLLVVGLALVSLLLVGVSLALHITDTVLAHRRAYSALAAVGVPARVIATALRREALLATVPLAVLGCLVGSSFSGVVDVLWLWPLVLLASALVAVLATVASAYLASALLAPVIRDAMRPTSLRTD